MKRVITIVGRSIFDNAVKEGCNTILSSKVEHFKNDPLFANWKDFEVIIEGKKGKEETGLRYITNNVASKLGIYASAEITSLVKIAEQEGDLDVYLLATDTVLSVLASELICDWFKEKYPSVQIEKDGEKPKISIFFNQNDSVIKELQVKDADTFETKGFRNLFAAIKKWSDKTTILNITSGYKAILPFLTIYGQLANKTLKYIFEDSDKLISIGNLPVQFDWSIGELYHDFICEEDIRLRLTDDNPIYTSLIGYELIHSNKNLTTLGELFRDYINAKMPEAKGTFGYFAEYKVYEALIENPYSDFIKTKRSRKYYWKKHDRTMCSEDELLGNDEVNWEPIELDIVLKNANNNQIWIEVKSFTDSKLNEAKIQIEKRLQFYEQVKKCDGLPIDFQLKEFFLIVYKFDFQDIGSKCKKTNAIKNLFIGKSIDFKMYYFDVPVNLEKHKINYKAVFDKSINLENHLV